jgi:hypothetical protein
LYNVTLTRCGANSSLAFSWAQFDDGSADLSLTYQVTAQTAYSGSRRIASNETAMIDADTEFRHQAYVGPRDFTIEASLLPVDNSAAK